jgi:PadR family transcriptional regulator PadR
MNQSSTTHLDPTDLMLEEWKKSMLTFWALSLLTLRPMYGLEIKKEIETSSQGKMRLGASTIYQILRRMERHGLVTSNWVSTTQGPPRAYYEPTDAGKQTVKRYLVEVFSPESPLPAALGRLIAQLFEKLG